MILKDLRISPLRNILTGISMFVGIIAMISSVLVGTLGKEYLISVNAQMYGWSPTYSFSITGSDFQDTIKMENFFREIYNTDHFVAVTFSMLEEITVAPVASVSSLQDISDTVYKKTVPVDVVFTTSTYNKIYNLPMSSGDWFDSSEINKTLCMVVNKAAQNYFDTSYAVGNVESSLSLTPFNVVGTVNDGTDIPTVYLDAHSIELLVPNMWKVKNATVHWHSEAGITMRQMYSSLHDILEDTIGGNLDIIGKSDIGDTYNSVLSVLQLGLLVTSFLLLFVSVLGQINIGLSSLEQRTHELLIWRFSCEYCYFSVRRTINYISVCLYCFNPDILFLGSRHGVISACGFSRSGTGISYSFGSGSCYNIRCCSVAWRTIASVKSCKA